MQQRTDTCAVQSQILIAERTLESLENLEKIFVEISPVKLNEALQALTTLKLYEEQQTSFLVDPDFSRMLRIHERKLLKRHMKGLKQRDLRDWLGRGSGGEADLVGPTELPQDLRRAWLSPCGLALLTSRGQCSTASVVSKALTRRGLATHV